MRRVAGGLDPDALVAGAYDVRNFQLTPKTKFLLASGYRRDVRQDTEKRVVLPNGHVVKVTTDASSTATHVEENDRLHAVARPETVRLKLSGTPTPEKELAAFLAQCKRYGVPIPRKFKTGRPN